MRYPLLRTVISHALPPVLYLTNSRLVSPYLSLAYTHSLVLVLVFTCIFNSGSIAYPTSLYEIYVLPYIATNSLLSPPLLNSYLSYVHLYTTSLVCSPLHRNKLSPWYPLTKLLPLIYSHLHYVSRMFPLVHLRSFFRPRQSNCSATSRISAE